MWVLIKKILKGLAVFIASGLIGIVALFIFSLKSNLENAAKDVGLGIIALAPALVIIYSIVYFLAGGFLGLSAYLIYKYWKHKIPK